MKINSIEDLNSLKENQISESKEIDYKELLALTSPTDKTNFIQNLTSFSNAIGGNLIYGIKAKDGIPTEITGIETNNNDSLKLQLDNIIQDLTSPRVSNYNFKFIPISEARQVLVIEIQKSWNSPHAVKINKGFVFYSRNSAGKFPLDIFEIRNLFLESSAQIENAKSFRIKRITEIISDQTPVPIFENYPSKFILHSIPLNAFNPSTKYDLKLIKDYNMIGTMIESYSHRMINFEGVLLYTSHWENQKSCGNYTQLYRNGIIESLDAFSVNFYTGDICKVHLYSLENEVKEFIYRTLNVYSLLKVQLPILISISFLNMKGKELSQKISYARSKSLLRENYYLPDFLIESYDEDWETSLAESFIPLWNAFGIENRLD